MALALMALPHALVVVAATRCPPTRSAPLQCCEPPVGGGDCLYAPFLECARAAYEDAGLCLRDYPLADDRLLSREGSSGAGARQQRVSLSASAQCSDELRQVRSVLIDGGSALQVLNFCIFPSLDYGLPSFAADLVTLPGGHLIALDFAPNGDAAADAAFGPDGELAAAYARHRPLLPEGGAIPDAAAAYFSPYFLWSRLPLDEASERVVRTRVLAAFDDYLRAYLRLVRDARPLEDSAERRSVLEAQLAYANYRASSDPARPM